MRHCVSQNPIYGYQGRARLPVRQAGIKIHFADRPSHPLRRLRHRAFGEQSAREENADQSLREFPSFGR